MIDARQFAALFAIFAGGFLNAGIGAQFQPSSPRPRAPVAACRPPVEPAQRCSAPRSRAAARNCAPTSAIPPRTCSFRRCTSSAPAAAASKAAAGACALSTAARPCRWKSAWLWDLPTHAWNRPPTWSPAPRPARLDAATQRRIADRIGSRLVVEFAGQPVDFALRRVEHLAAGREKLLVSGEGIADFGAEGSARTRFVATADRAVGKSAHAAVRAR
jgi:hypothetical protein